MHYADRVSDQTLFQFRLASDGASDNDDLAETAEVAGCSLSRQYWVP